MLKILLIAAGGSVGAVMRYGLSAWGLRLTGGAYPLGTVLANAGGCFAIGCLGAWFAGTNGWREEYRFALTVGVLGAFTTFSSFGLETYTIARSGQAGLAVANVVLTNVLALGGVWLGYTLVERAGGG